MDHIAELVKARRSVRTFAKRELDAETVKKLSDFTESIENPYKVPVKFRFLDAKKQNLKCPVVNGASLFVGVKVPRVKYAEEAVGYSFETLILFAQSIGIGTVWIGGTMDRAAFEKAMELGENEMMPCVSPLGYTAEKMSMREMMMRKGVRADHREAFEALFFDGTFDAPLTREKAGSLAAPLETVRLAPSAVNKQPWRVVVNNSGVHFYLKHSSGFKSNLFDMQKIDMGIALCHFALSTEEQGLNLRFCTDAPELAVKPDTEYIASFSVDS